MKNIDFAYMAVFMLLLSACCKCDSIKDQCGVANHLEELTWLKIKVIDRESFGDSIAVEEIEIPIENIKGYLFKFRKRIDPTLPFKKYYFTCDGNLVCYDSGYPDNTDCDFNEADVKIGTLLYHTN